MSNTIIEAAASNSNVKSVAGASRPFKYGEVAVNVDEDAVMTAAQAATAVLWAKYGEALGCSRDQLVQFNVVGLKAALAKAIDADAKIDREIAIPVYFDSMIRGLNCKIGRVVISTTLSNLDIRTPDGYKQVKLGLMALGIGTVRPHAPAQRDSQTLTLMKEDIDGTLCIVGNYSSVDVSDIVRRALLELEEESNNYIKEISGDLALQYGEVDGLVTSYISSEAKVAIS